MSAFDELMDLAKALDMGESSTGNETLASTKLSTRAHIRKHPARQNAHWVRPSKKRRFVNNNKVINPQ